MTFPITIRPTSTPVRALRAIVGSPHGYTRPYGFYVSSNYAAAAVRLGLVARGYAEVRRNRAGHPTLVRATAKGADFVDRRWARLCAQDD